METLNTMFIIDLVIVAVGLYFMYISLRMKKTMKVDKFVIAEETLKNCKDEKAFAEFLWIRQFFLSIIMILAPPIIRNTVPPNKTVHFIKKLHFLFITLYHF